MKRRTKFKCNNPHCPVCTLEIDLNYIPENSSVVNHRLCYSCLKPMERVY